MKKNLETESKESAEKRFKDRLLVLSRFLRAAAAMRGVADEHSIQARGFEGTLYQVYGGTEQAVDAMVKLIDGTDDKVPSVESEILDITCKFRTPFADIKLSRPSPLTGLSL